MTTRYSGPGAPATVRELSVEGAYEITPKVFRDRRGLFVTTYQEPQFARSAGHSFPVFQTCQSQSHRGVVRGVHFTATPPGMAKYVYCGRGRARDFVVDLRVGSPTFGTWDTSELGAETFRSLYLPVGVGHVFIALEDDTAMMYLMSGPYVPEHELAVSPQDPELALPLALDGAAPVMSDRDLAAPSLAQALAAGVLPEFEACRALEAAL